MKRETKGGDVKHRQPLEKYKIKLEVVQFPRAKVGALNRPKLFKFVGNLKLIQVMHKMN